MSLITRCPACTTMFKVVPDQLRVSGGWVRCGHCQEVFDASANLQSPPVAAVQAPKAPSEPNPGSAAQQIEVREPFLDVNPGALDLERQTFTEPTLEPDGIVQTVAPASASSPSPSPSPSTEPASASEPSLSTPTEPAIDYAQVHDTSREEEPVMVPSFVARTRPRTRSAWSTVGWSFTGLVLALALAVQVGVHERNRIAAYEPSARVVLTPLCEFLSCVVAPVRQIESVVIDSSAFTKVRNDVYRLTVTYKNTAPISVEVPALELTLTDLQDQPVLRRVFLSKELGLQRPTLDSGGEAAIAVPVTLRLAQSAEKISGYRLLAFYP